MYEYHPIHIQPVSIPPPPVQPTRRIPFGFQPRHPHDRLTVRVGTEPVPFGFQGTH